MWNPARRLAAPSTRSCVSQSAAVLPLTHKEKFPLLATSLQAAAGVAGKQRWALSSSARVSLVTYTAVIAVRYPELDNLQSKFFFGNSPLHACRTSF